MKINKILFITLSNFGDVILTLPALDYLRARFPQAEITVMVGNRPKEIFEDNPDIHKLIIYDKRARLSNKIRLFNKLKQERFNLVVDLRNTLFGVFLPAQYRTCAFSSIPRKIKHMKERHFYKIKNKNLKLKSDESLDTPRNSLHLSHQDEEYINQILRENHIGQEDKIIVIAPGARSQIKRWAKEKFSKLIPALIEEFQAKIILVGDKADSLITKYIAENSQYPVIDLAGKTNIRQLAGLLKMVRLLITNDSATLHLASYLNVRIVAIFGPTNELSYGPWSGVSKIVKRDIFCRPCQKAQCRFETLECMSLIKAEDVLRQVRDILRTSSQSQALTPRDNFRRILIVRTDRIGDVLLSTPLIKALRERYPDAYLAMMVSPYAKDIVDGNPYLDKVIIYDKDGKGKSWYGSIKFALNLKKKRFDLALVLHPTNRVHLITYFAGIPRRVGFNRKLGFLLTDRIKHTKQWGEKHELEYNLDFLRYLGIEAADKNLFMPIKPEAENWVADIFRTEGVKPDDKLLAIHPAASCPSKIWPQERFARVADILAEKYGFKILLIAAAKDAKIAQNLAKNMQHPALNLAGRTSVSQLASLLKRCQLFISNDSGPVHIACAVATPVISIFGRNQKGLNPIRWGPLGAKDKFLHKEVGCIECLAHNCKKEFACLKAITVDDVVAAAEAILK